MLDTMKKNGSPFSLRFLSGMVGNLTERFIDWGQPARTPLPKPTIPTVDDSQESELSPSERSDVDATDYYPTEDEQKLINLVLARSDESSRAKKPHEGQWLESLAFYRGGEGHWKGWNHSTGRLESRKAPGEPYRIYAVINKLKPKINKIIARAMQSQVSVGVRPRTDSPTDIGAARQGDAVLSDLDVKCDRPNQDKRMITGAITTCPHYLKCYIDPQGEVDYAIFDELGNVAEVITGKGPVICEVICSAFEIDGDPKAENILDGNWLIHRKYQSLQWIQERFALGKWVESEAAASSNGGQIDSLLNGITNDVERTPQNTGGGMAMVYEMWEKPSPSFPNGRLVYVANGVLLYAGDFPYTEIDGFPFAELPYEAGIESPFGSSAVTQAVGPMRERNRTVSLALEHLRNGFGKVLAPRGCEIRPDAFRSGKPNEVIDYSVNPVIGNAIPTLFPTAPLDPTIPMVLNLLDADMDEILETNDVSRGIKPTGVTAASAIQALQDSDLSGAVLFRTLLQSYHKRRGQIEIGLAKQFYTEPRLLSVSSSSPAAQKVLQEGDIAGQLAQAEALSAALTQAGAAPEEVTSLLSPQEAGGSVGMNGATPAGLPNPGMVNAQEQPQQKSTTQGFDFKHLSTGRIVIEASSSAPKTPAARVQQILDMASRGMFLPEALPTTIPLLRVLEIQDADKLTSDLIAALTVMMKMNAKAVQEQPAPPTPEEIAALKQQELQAKATMDAQLQQAKTEAETNSKFLLGQQSHEQKMAEIALQKQLELNNNLTETAVNAQVDEIHGQSEHSRGMERDEKNREVMKNGKDSKK